MPETDENQNWGGGPAKLDAHRAKYQPAGPGDGICSDCHWFQGFGKPCALVEVPVEKGYTCRLFSPEDFYITKADEDRQLVFGWASVAVTKDGRQVTDRHGDLIELRDLEDAAYDFVLKYRESGDMHEGSAKGRLVESMVFTPEKLEKMGLAPDALPGGWWTGFHVDDPGLWRMVKSGERPMFSIQGVAVPEQLVEKGVLATPEPKDHMNTVAHLASIIAFNHEHAEAHVAEAKEHAVKLMEHLRKHPELAAELDELKSRNPDVKKALVEVEKMKRERKRG